MVSGLTLTRDDQRWVFSKSGIVDHFPNLRLVPGAETLKWKVEGDWLVLTDHQGRSRGEFRLERIGPVDFTVVTRDGKKLWFAYRKT